jgi:hypothetical protein
LWTPYPVLAEPEAVVAVGPGEAPQAAVAERPDAFTVTDEMIASLLAEPFAVRRRRRLQLLPLIPVVHGFGALATFMLTTLATLSGR